MKEVFEGLHKAADTMTSVVNEDNSLSIECKFDVQHIKANIKVTLSAGSYETSAIDTNELRSNAHKYFTELEKVMDKLLDSPEFKEVLDGEV